MKKIAITTDTNSGMMPNAHDAQGIFVLPMPFVIDDECLLESVNLSREEFFTKLIGGSKVSTAQPSVGEVSEFWTNILKEYDQIVHIPTSCLLSNAYSTAKVLAKEEFDGKVFVVDNRRISVPLKLSALDGAKLRDAGKSAEEIVSYLEADSANYTVYLSLESMEYLKRGGRISPAVAAIGSMLKLRPILRLSGGPLEKFAMPRTMLKAKDQMKEAVKQDLTEKFKEFADKDEMVLTIAYGEFETEASAFHEEIQKAFPNVEITENEAISLSIACHTGPGTLTLICTHVVK